jgi:BR serine/threonine kinase
MAISKSHDLGSYTLLHTLGTGTSSKVKLAEHKQTHLQVAIKVIRKDDFHLHPEILQKIHREIALMRLMDHPHLLRLHEILESHRHLYLVMDYASHGELLDYVVARGQLTPPEAIRIFRQILYGLDYLHRHSICHRDLKLENILLDDHDNVKIGDFGFARWMSSNVADTSCGSPHYASPEVIMGKPYDGRKADVWSSGVVLYSLLTGRLPFEGSSLRVLASKICGGEYRLPDFPDPMIKDLLSKLLMVDPTQRLSLDQIKRHPFFRSGLPKAYTCPSPLPLPSVAEPIDPRGLDPKIMEIFTAIGWQDQKELFKDLQSPTSTMAKSFCVMLANKRSFEGLPWPVTDEPPEEPANPIDSVLLEPLHFSFATGDAFAPRAHDAKPDSASMYSLAETVPWDPALFVDAADEEKSVASLADIRSPLEHVMAAVQRRLIQCGFEWFYPNDLLILARKHEPKTDVILNVGYQDDGDLRITLNLVQGAATEFSSLVVALAHVVNELE